MSPWSLPQPLQTTLDFFQTTALPTAENSSVVSGIQPVIAVPNQRWQQCFTDDNLDTAKDWLLKQSREQDHSDTWDYVRHWAVNKADLQQRLADNRFCFHAVHEIEINDAQGRISRREIRCAEDRLVIRAIAQVLKPVFSEALSKDCMHLSGNGGGKAAVAQTQDYISQHPDHQVIKSDVKRYYANIDHVILHEQLHQLLPHEKTLNRLLWNFMRRTVEFGGNYREVEIGLPLGASLSPLFSALYLSPLDELAKNTPNTFYRRYMDDWVWVFPKKQTLRTTMKKQYGILHALRVAIHPDKTFIGKVKKGFDFLGFHLKPTGVAVSDGALSRHEDKVARLYEQDAKPKRIRAYRLRWLVWAALGFASTPMYAGTDSAHCAAQGSMVTFGIRDDDTPQTEPVSDYFTDFDCFGSPLSCETYDGITVSNAYTRGQPPAVSTLTFASVSAYPDMMAGTPEFPIYLITASSGDHICLFKLTGLDSAEVFSPTTSAQNIPIFGPFGLLSLMGGLLWFGNRRRKS